MNAVSESVVRVHKGDTLYTLSRRYDIDLRDLIDVNHIQAPFKIKPGQYIKIPKKRRHSVRFGQTVNSIARHYNMDVSTLVQLNNLQAPYTLKQGQELKLAHPKTKTMFRRKPLTQNKNVIKKLFANAHAQHDRFKGAEVEQRAPVKHPVIHNHQPLQNHMGVRDTSEVIFPKKKPFHALDAVKIKQRNPGNLDRSSVSPSSHKKIVYSESTYKNVAKRQSKKINTSKSLSFNWPARGKIISNYGRQKNKLNNDGINILLPKGTVIQASESGLIAYAGDALKGYGNLVLIKHSHGMVTTYAHMDHLTVKHGDQVRKGETIGYAGASGNVTKSQLHFEIRKKAQPQDPLKILPSR